MKKNQAIYMVPKEEWAEGPWHKEPDHHEFTYKDCRFFMTRNTMGCWLGYIQIPMDSPYAKDWDSLDVHGGFSWHEDRLPNGEPDGYFYLGFDCSHAFDLMPAYEAYMDRDIEAAKFWKNIKERRKAHPELVGVTYRDMDYVINELKSVRDQMDSPTIKKN